MITVTSGRTAVIESGVACGHGDRGPLSLGVRRQRPQASSSRCRRGPAARRTRARRPSRRAAARSSLSHGGLLRGDQGTERVGHHIGPVEHDQVAGVVQNDLAAASSSASRRWSATQDRPPSPAAVSTTVGVPGQGAVSRIRARSRICARVRRLLGDHTGHRVAAAVGGSGDAGRPGRTRAGGGSAPPPSPGRPTDRAARSGGHASSPGVRPWPPAASRGPPLGPSAPTRRCRRPAPDRPPSRGAADQRLGVRPGHRVRDRRAPECPGPRPARPGWRPPRPAAAAGRATGCRPVPGGRAGRPPGRRAARPRRPRRTTARRSRRAAARSARPAGVRDQVHLPTAQGRRPTTRRLIGAGLRTHGGRLRSAVAGLDPGADGRSTASSRPAGSRRRRTRARPSPPSPPADSRARGTRATSMAIITVSATTSMTQMTSTTRRRVPGLLSGAQHRDVGGDHRGDDADLRADAGVGVGVVHRRQLAGLLQHPALLAQRRRAVHGEEGVEEGGDAEDSRPARRRATSGPGPTGARPPRPGGATPEQDRPDPQGQHDHGGDQVPAAEEEAVRLVGGRQLRQVAVEDLRGARSSAARAPRCCR